jgi:hypothetical protein
MTNHTQQKQSQATRQNKPNNPCLKYKARIEISLLIIGQGRQKSLLIKHWTGQANYILNTLPKKSLLKATFFLNAF